LDVLKLGLVLDSVKNPDAWGKDAFHTNFFSPDGVAIDGPWLKQEPLYLQWKQLDCQIEMIYFGSVCIYIYNLK
jgi:hypothetical protein